MARYVQKNTRLSGGRVLVGVIQEDVKPSKRSGNVWRKGHRSRAMQVHPKQAKRFTEAAHAAGIHDVSYDARNGELVSTSRSGRKFEMIRRGFFDKDGSYGDAQPNH